MRSLQDAYEEICAYAMERLETAVQSVADAFTAQTANGKTKPISLVLALTGLYLHVEKSYSSLQVQRVHRQLTRMRPELPTVYIPTDRGAIDVIDVTFAEPGPDRDRMIHAWCGSVWSAFCENR